MGTNYHTAYAAGVTGFTAALMGAPLSELDRAVTYHKTAFVGCDGTVSYDNTTGVLTWSGTLHIYFTRADGTAIHNSIASGNITLADGEYCYVTLSETNDAVLTMAKASLGAGSTSTFKAYNILPMGYRNASDNNFYPEELAGVFAMMLAGSAYVEKATFDANTILKADTDNTPAALTVAEQRIVGRKTGGNIDALTGAEALTILNGMQAGQQSITCSDNVTIDWSAGSTAYMTFDRASVAVTLNNPVNGQVYRFLVAQDGTGGRVLSWSTTVKWRGGSPPTLSAAANAIDILTLVYINGTWYGDAALNFA
ncbi:MAG: hypothetical protein A4E73_02415 [Syntrophaceae bacterium PtaU1.Bin231]|nr:MAG: hypothetical protein A4E73_02415 [Syntrophaceae bacterium PtaU1.Bin231]